MNDTQNKTNQSLRETLTSPGDEIISATTVWLTVPLCFGFSAKNVWHKHSARTTV